MPTGGDWAGGVSRDGQYSGQRAMVRQDLAGAVSRGKVEDTKQSLLGAEFVPLKVHMLRS